MAAKAKKIDVSVEELLEKGAHYGHKTKRWNPKSGPYVHGVIAGAHIFDLFKTREALISALSVISDASKKGETILVVGTKKQVKDKVKETAQRAGIPYVDQRWLGGTLTNFDQIKRSIEKMKKIKKGLSEGEYDDLTKKERLSLKRKAGKLASSVGGIAELAKIPELIIFMDVNGERQAVREAKLMGVSTIGIVDSNADPTTVDYPIPMNDDSAEAFEYVLDLIAKAIK